MTKLAIATVSPDIAWRSPSQQCHPARRSYVHKTESGITARDSRDPRILLIHLGSPSQSQLTEYSYSQFSQTVPTQLNGMTGCANGEAV